MNNDPNSYWKPEDQSDSEQPAQPQPEATALQPVQQPAGAQVQQPILEEVQPTLQPERHEETLQDAPITWAAQEYIHLERNALWYVLFVLAVLALIAIDIFILKSWTFSALVIVMAIAVIVYIRRPPRTLTYALSGAQGLYIGERLYHIDEFKSFGLIRDGEHNSIMLIPRKRFSPGVSVFFPEEAGERIIDILGQRLPMEELKLDVIDIVVRKLRL